MKVYFIRHGQTDSNKENRHQFPETPLSDLGIKQADALAKRFQHLQVDVILSSTYNRALNTAKAVEKVTQAPLITTDLLIERKHPTVVRGKLMSDPEIIEVHKQLSEHFNEKDWHYSDEENFYDVLERAKQALDFITSQEKENVVVVTHGYFLLLLIAAILFNELLTPNLYQSFRNKTKYSNTGLTLCEFEKGKWDLLTLNDYAHLGE